MLVYLIEPFFGGSHRQWAIQLQEHSKHKIKIFSLPGRHWKWRMHGGAITLANQVNQEDKCPDVILVTDMTDVSLFKSLCKFSVPIIVYFHENQLNYPWSPEDQDIKYKRDLHYAFLNYTSALVADKILFNSDYHRTIFIHELPKFLKQFPDNENLSTVDLIERKSQTCYVGVNALEKENRIQRENILLWNHRWEYDKNPAGFYELMKGLKENNTISYVFLGEQCKKYPEVFNQIQNEFSNAICQFGYVKDMEEYHKWLSKSTLLPVTSVQDFFGISIVEAIQYGVIPILPDRLSYRELIPSSFHELLLYHTGKDLIDKVNELLDIDLAPIRQALMKYVKKFEWQQLVMNYDRIVEEVAKPR